METNSRKLIKKLEEDEFVKTTKSGSHQKLYRERDNRTVIVPHPKKDLPIGTVRNIYKAAGWI